MIVTYIAGGTYYAQPPEKAILDYHHNALIWLLGVSIGPLLCSASSKILLQVFVTISVKIVPRVAAVGYQKWRRPGLIPVIKTDVIGVLRSHQEPWLLVGGSF